MHIPLTQQIRRPFPTRYGCVYLSGHTIPVTVEHTPTGARVSYRSGGTLGVYFHYVSRCLGNRKDAEDVFETLMKKGMVRL